MKANKPILLIAATGFVIALIGCNGAKPSAGADFQTAATTTGVGGATITIQPTPATVVGGQTLQIYPSGGTPPYHYIIVNSFGSVSPPSGTYTVYQAPTSAGTAQLEVQDSASPPN